MAVSTHDLLEKTLAVEVFPNPTPGHVSLKINGFDASETHHTALFDLNGKLVFETQFHGNELEIGGLAKGVYLAKITFGKGEVSRKIIVQ